MFTETYFIKSRKIIAALRKEIHETKNETSKRPHFASNKLMQL